jgi:outer membrane protein assembly factor BamB
VYIVTDKGIAWCLDLRTGRVLYGPERLKPGTYSASPVLADGRIYVTSEEGLTSVLKAGPAFEVLAENALDEYTLSSPAISNGQIFLRTDKHLYAIGTAR